MTHSIRAIMKSLYQNQHNPLLLVKRNELQYHNLDHKSGRLPQDNQLLRSLNLVLCPKSYNRQIFLFFLLLQKISAQAHGYSIYLGHHPDILYSQNQSCSLEYLVNN